MQGDSPLDHDDHDSAGHEDDEAKQPWESTRAGKRIAELKEIEDNIAVLLHFAGCALASLHPDPLSSFTSRELAVEGEDDEPASDKPKASAPDGQDKAVEFGKYAEAYYSTLNDIQVGLRTSIRHSRVTRISPAPLLDPTFGSLASSGGPQPSQVGVGGLALADLLTPLDPTIPRWTGAAVEDEVDGTREAPPQGNQLSIAAKELESEAWRDLADALESSTIS
ncbi:hypothetical protein JCM11491_001003 [Sporobolomyces phaffii]